MPKTSLVKKPILAPPVLNWEESAYFILRRGRDRLLWPLSTLLAQLRVPPSAISLLGVCLAATTCMTLSTHQGLALGGFLGSLFCDAMDGALARRLGSSSTLGKLVDQLADTFTFTLLMVAVAAAGLASPWAAAFAAVASVVLLGLGFRHHTAQRPRLYPRGGFFAHCPKAIVYAALAAHLLGLGQWIGPALGASNALSVLFAGGFLWAHTGRQPAPQRELPVL